MKTGKTYAAPNFVYVAYEQAEAISVEISADLPEDNDAVIIW